MRTFEYCRNCQEVREFWMDEGVEYCGTCGEPLGNSEDDYSEYNTDDYEEDGDNDLS